MSELEALLPDADPLATFQMADYLRSSQVRDPMAAEADLQKLIALLGGEVAPVSQPMVSHPLSSPNGSLGIDAQGHEVESLAAEPTAEPTGEPAWPCRACNGAVTVGLAKRMRKKRQQAHFVWRYDSMAAVGGLVVLGLYLNQPTKPSPAVAQLPVPPKPQPPAAQANPVEPSAVDGQAIIQLKAPSASFNWRGRQATGDPSDAGRQPGCHAYARKAS